jgi:hypothetical protein
MASPRVRAYQTIGDSRLVEWRGTREMGKGGEYKYMMGSCRDQAGIVEHNGAFWWKQNVYWFSSLSPRR